MANGENSKLATGCTFDLIDRYESDVSSFVLPETSAKYRRVRIFSKTLKAFNLNLIF